MSIIDTLNNKIDIVELVRKYTDLHIDSNNTMRGVCPVHKGSNPTSLVVIDNKFVYCHSCMFGGDAISFYSEMESLPYYAAIEKLAEEYEINLESNKEYQSQKEIVGKNTQLAFKFNKAVSNVSGILHKRGFTDDTINEFMLGYCSDKGFIRSKAENSVFDGIIIPIQDIYSRTVGFSKRRIDSDNKPTYINSKSDDVFDKSSILFNLNRARKRLKETKKLYIVEGYMDSISGHQQGLACVSYLSGHLTKNQIGLLAEINKMNNKIEFVLACDNPSIDETGSKECVIARESIIKYAPQMLSKVRLYVWKDKINKDFNDLLKANEDIGSAETESIDKGVIRILLNDCSHIEEEYSVAESFMKTVKSELVKGDICSYLAERWNKPIEDVKKQFSVVTEDINEKIKDFSDVFDCFNDLKKVADEEPIHTGFMSIDNNIDLYRKWVVVLSAYSSSGKTQNAIQMILHWIIREKRRVLFFSMELPKEDVVEILISKVLQIPQYKVREMINTEQGKEVYEKVLDKISKYLYVIDKNALTIDDIEEYVKIANSKVFDKDVDIVLTDYYQYLSGISDFQSDAMTARKMKKIAKDNNLLFFMLSQFNKESQAKDKGGKVSEPTMNMIKGAGDIGASADCILLMWRPAMSMDCNTIGYEEMKYITNIKIAKARKGLKLGKTHHRFKYNIDKNLLEDYNE